MARTRTNQKSLSFGSGLTAEAQATQFSAPFQSHSPTSKEAAEEIGPQRNKLQQAVLEYIRTSGGCTDEQGAASLRMNPSTYRPRRIELEGMGLIVAGGVGKTASGRRAVIWKCK